MDTVTRRKVLSLDMIEAIIFDITETDMNMRQISKKHNVSCRWVSKLVPKSMKNRFSQGRREVKEPNKPTAEEANKLRETAKKLRGRGMRLTFANLAEYSHVKRSKVVQMVSRLHTGELVLREEYL